jgi:transposase
MFNPPPAHGNPDSPRAALYTLIETCRLNDVDPLAWLDDILARFPGHSAQRLDELLSWTWKAGQIRPAAA